MKYLVDIIRGIFLIKTYLHASVCISLKAKSARKTEIILAKNNRTSLYYFDPIRASKWAQRICNARYKIFEGYFSRPL